MTFTLERFVDDCIAAVRADATHRGTLDVVTRAFADPAAIVAALGVPTEGRLDPLYRSDSLTILNVVWKPGMTLQPHDHRIWAIIGIYQGQEDNLYWRRLPGCSHGSIALAATQSITVGEVTPLGKDIIHSVSNPTDGLTGAIHVYGGDFFAVERSEWDPDTLIERPYDLAKAQALFAS
jgi:predicted metal-dependent enzyme (double-stranded beta helix superfamily)